MDGPGDDDTQASAAETVDRRQLFLVAVCFAAILVAAALAPTPVTPDVQVPNTSDPTPDEPTRGGGGGGGETGEGDVVGTPAGGGRVLGEGGNPVPVPGGSAPKTEGCAVVLVDEPIPGTRATVGVYVDTEPVSGVDVRFNGEPVGRTDERGRVDGPVPYERTLAVNVGLDDCEFYRERFDDRASDLDDASVGTAPDVPGSANADVQPDGADSDVEPDGADSDVEPDSADADVEPDGADADVQPGGANAGVAGSDASGPPGGSTDAAVRRAVATQSGNVTGTYAVRGDLNLTLRGAAYPGTAVTLAATIEGVPVPEASVEVGETSAGATGERGRTDLTVPDGRQEVPVTVGRGDFEATTTLDVLLLTASVDPREGFPVPGERAAVEAEIDEQPADDVAVRVGGWRAGATDREGQLGFGLPLWTAGDVVATTEHQSVAVPLWRVYVPTALNLFVLLSAGVVGIGGTRLFRGPDAAARVAVGWLALFVADLALVVGELTGLAVALAGMGAVGLVHQHRRVRAGGEQAVGTVVGLVMVVRRTALGVTVAVERVVDRVRGLLGRTWTRLTSFEQFAAWVGGFVRKVVATVWLYLTLRRAGVVLFALAELAVATVRWGNEGLVASVAGLAVLAGLVALLRRDDPAPPPDDDGGEGDTTGVVRRAVDRESGETGERILSIRELWRRFARWVVPGTWRTKTPGEVARAAVERGFPREPVEALTDAFRDVEYGAEPATSRRERAKAAFDRLARANEEDDG